MAMLLRPRRGAVWLQRGIIAWQLVSRLRGIRRMPDTKSGS